ncbi:MAG TPA: radical SAM protein [Clostridiales bacterium]|nr:radical SAM protein [Clostridiales bacterium]
MTITYKVGNSLYINITNRCTNACEFCVRTQSDGYYAPNLWLDREPTVEEICQDLASHDLDVYDEIVFCGYGEPTCRFEEMLAVCDYIRKATKTAIRLNTNGHANLICGRDVTPELAGRFDTISVSLNAANANDYQKICRSVFGEAAYDAMLAFAAGAKKYVPRVVLTVVRGTIPDDDIEECKKIASSHGLELRVRDYIRKEQ